MAYIIYYRLYRLYDILDAACLATIHHDNSIDTSHTTPHIISLRLSLSVTLSSVSGTTCLSVTTANSGYQSRWRARRIILLLSIHVVESPWCSDTRRAFWIECGANSTANLVEVETFWKAFNVILSFSKYGNILEGFLPMTVFKHYKLKLNLDMGTLFKK